MADSNNGSDRNTQFKAAALVLVEDAVDLAVKLRKCIHRGTNERAQWLAANLQRTARDAKWLLARLPNE